MQLCYLNMLQNNYILHILLLKSIQKLNHFHMKSIHHKKKNRGRKGELDDLALDWVIPHFIISDWILNEMLAIKRGLPLNEVVDHQY